MLNIVAIKESQLWFLLQWLDELAYYGCNLGQICIYVVPGSKLKPSYTASLRGDMENWTFLNETLACAEMQTLPSSCMPKTIYKLQQASLQSWYSTFYS